MLLAMSAIDSLSDGGYWTWHGDKGAMFVRVLAFHENGTATVIYIGKGVMPKDRDQTPFIVPIGELKAGRPG
jgi:hypothetical protein